MANTDTDKRKLLEADEIRRLVERLSEDIVQMVGVPERLALVGIRTHGVTLAGRIQAILKDKHGWDVPMGIIDITLYRDDLGHRAAQPIVRPTEIDFDIEGRLVVLVDDVIATACSRTPAEASAVPGVECGARSAARWTRLSVSGGPTRFD